MTNEVTSYFISKHGSTATLRTFSKTGEDEYNDPTYDDTDETITVIESAASATIFPEPRNFRLAETMEFDTQFFTLDDVSVSVPSEGRRSVLIHGGEQYEIVDTRYSKDTGLTRLACNLMRT